MSWGYIYIYIGEMNPTLLHQQVPRGVQDQMHLEMSFYLSAKVPRCLPNANVAPFSAT